MEKCFLQTSNYTSIPEYVGYIVCDFLFYPFYIFLYILHVKTKKLQTIPLTGKACTDGVLLCMFMLECLCKPFFFFLYQTCYIYLLCVITLHRAVRIPFFLDPPVAQSWLHPPAERP